MQTLMFDVVTIGGGPGATPGAQLLAQKGQKVAIVEKGAGLGGTCLFEGCIPSKIFLESAARIRAIGVDVAFGVQGAHFDSINLDRIRARKQEILAKRAGGAQVACDKLGITVIQGVADLLDPHHVTVQTANHETILLEAKTLVIAPGSVSRPLEVPGADNEGLWTSQEALELAEIPKSLCIIGGGYIGMELATLYHALGSQVHILEAGPRILLTEDPGIADHLVQTWQKTGVSIPIETGITLDAIESTGKALGHQRVHYRAANGEVRILEADRVLIAVGRAPATSHLHWDRVGITLGARKEVPVNEFYQTVVPSIYAPGDVNGEVMLAHAATRQSLIAAQHILGRTTVPNALVVPHVVFTDPEIAAVGADSRDLAAHPQWAMTSWPYRQDARALIMGDAEGFAQMIWDQKTHALLGLQVIGAEAGELIEEATYIITHHGTLESLVESIHPHPTLNEVVSELAAHALDEAERPEE
ncbi:dihydrolipoyl dehydrogenase [Sulfobacillus thermotolerans]|uniref:Dihydrolipoyl dehydrogenase n=1 Tax=Sulfobacillus thermotolerans TaxID=338644 RepID=A0ABN5GX47_9FIRM|nr:dihydrolipoyl dehydrogenase [Sulfobacillus thermotolerans]